MLCEELEEWDGGWGGKKVQGEGNICICISDSLHCTVEETNTTFLKQLYPNKKEKETITLWIRLSLPKN